MALIFEDAEKAKNAIMESQKKEIQKLYEDWADEIGERAKYYSHLTTASSALQERQMKELQKMLQATGQEVSNEIYSKIKGNMYTIADAVVADNVKWLESLGFTSDSLNAAFNFVPDSVVRNLITGQIYSSGWSLSSRIWGDNEQTMKDAYQIMAKGLAENKSVYDIAKELENYVRPSAKKSWNPVLAMKNTQTGKIEYRRIYKKQVDYNAQRLARTLAQHSYQQSFIATTQKNPFITDYIWHSNGSRVCELCASRDGVHFKKNELPMDHPNGMCIMEPAIVDDLEQQIADWFNSPDGTYPEIDEFAKNFGYEAKVVGTTQDFVKKYGMSDKSSSAWYNSLTPEQKAEAKLLKEKSGLTWQKWYEQNIYSGGKVAANGTAKAVAQSADDVLAAAKAKFDSIPNKKYSGIWLKDATVADYESKADSIAQKKQWYLDEIDKLKSVSSEPWAATKIAKFQKYIDDLDEFESLGKQYVQAKKELSAAKLAVKKAKGTTVKLASSEYTDDALAAAQKKLNAIPNKKYSGIWKDDVTLADYESKASSIAQKKQYYENAISNLNDSASPVYNLATSIGKNPSELIAEFQKYLDDLDEFETLGKQYMAAKNEVMAAQMAYNKANGIKNVFTPDMYTDEAKAAARSFTSGMEADKFHRPYLDEIWKQTSEYEHYSVWEYTQNSNPINKSLSGYHDSWSRHDFKGLGNTDLGHEDGWRYFDTATFNRKFGVDGHKDYKSVVQNLTNIIDKSSMPDSVYLVRGSDNGGFAGLLEGNLFSYDDAMSLLNSKDANKIKTALEGQTFTNHSFMSTGIAKGTGFPGDVRYEIFAPKGTHAIYAEPASYYGNTVGMREKLYKAGQSYSSIGSEAEVIIQRGTDFRITEVDVDSYGRMTVKMEVVNQPDYFSTGLEHTHNGGKTSYKK